MPCWPRWRPKGFGIAKQSFSTPWPDLPPRQSALLRELAADALLGPDVRRPGLFSTAMKVRLLVRLVSDLSAGHGVSVETPSVQNALDKLREENFLWRSQRGSYSVEDEQFLLLGCRLMEFFRLGADIGPSRYQLFNVGDDPRKSGRSTGYVALLPDRC